ELAWENLLLAVERPDSRVREAMALASTTAGAAIASAKTTASHAFSYYLTAEHGVPHGPAAAITLGAVLRFNAAVTPASSSPGLESSKTAARIGEVVRRIGAADIEDAVDRLARLINSLGMPTRLSQVGVSSAAEIIRMARSVNAERLTNNPRVMTEG